MRRYLHWSIWIALIGLTIVAKSLIETGSRNYRAGGPPLQPYQAKYHTSSIKRYSMGFDNLIGATIWIQLLQKSTNEPVTDDQVSWEFAQLDALTTLDPHFERAYSFGAVFLSVFKQDKLGAKFILEKWAKRRPNYWQAEYLLGYHLSYEMGEMRSGAEHILRASRIEGAPAWLSSLGIRLLSQTGALAQALRMSIDLYLGLRNEEGRDRLRMRIRALNLGLQKAAWSQALENFRKANRSEPITLDELKPYLGPTVREVASILKNESLDDLGPVLAERFPFRYDANTRSIVPLGNTKDLKLHKLGIYVPEGT